MEYQIAVRMLREARLVNPDKSVSFQLRNFDHIAHHGTNFNEEMKTFVIKSMIGKIIHDRKEHYISEFEFKNRKIDIFHIKKDGFIKYEIANVPAKESKKKEQEGDIPGWEIIIETKKVPDDIKKMEEYLKKWVL